MEKKEAKKKPEEKDGKKCRVGRRKRKRGGKEGNQVREKLRQGK